MMLAAMMGLLLANSPFGAPLLDGIAIKLNLDFININITLGHVVSDLFLAVFFFVAGLELKYELRIGALSSPKRAMVPVIAAFAGIAVPSAIYAYMNWGNRRHFWLADSGGNRHCFRVGNFGNLRSGYAKGSENLSLSASHL